MAGLNDHKSKLLLMLGKPSSSAKEEPAEDEDAGGAGLQAAMEDMLAAINAKDPAAMAEAWNNAEACGAYEGPDETEE